MEPIVVSLFRERNGRRELVGKAEMKGEQLPNVVIYRGWAFVRSLGTEYVQEPAETVNSLSTLG